MLCLFITSHSCRGLNICTVCHILALMGEWLQCFPQLYIQCVALGVSAYVLVMALQCRYYIAGVSHVEALRLHRPRLQLVVFVLLCSLGELAATAREPVVHLL